MLRRNSKKGFTLMEMLIVVAIIAILIAIAIPTMTKSLEKSRESADLANIRSAYAEAMMDELDGDDEDGTAVSEKMTQAKEGWEYVEVPDYLGTLPNVTKGQTVTVTITNGEAVCTITGEGGGTEGGSSSSSEEGGASSSEGGEEGGASSSEGGEEGGGEGGGDD